MLPFPANSFWRYVPLFASMGVVAYGASSGKAVPADPVAALQERIKTGKLNLSFEPKHGYLKAILRELNVPISSQVLVFSKTSMQGAHINPKKPRAIYFNDQVYVGWVNGGDFIEIGSVDAEQGTHFYTIPNTKLPEPKFEKNPTECVACHGGRSARSIPSLIVRSVFPDPDGSPIFTSGGRFTRPSTPLEERWGGWYVTGTHGAQRHMGNILATGDDASNAMNLEVGANVTDLKRYFDVGEYLSPHSDIVALMVAEHQIEFQNRAGRVLIATRNMGNDSSRLSYVCEPIVETLLGVDELELKAPVKGSSSFTSDYAKFGPRDTKGRSLFDLDFKTRMFRYRCSPMIYSPVFEGLPAAAKERIYERLAEVLSGKDKSANFAAMTETERQTTGEILAETKPEFARAFR